MSEQSLLYNTPMWNIAFKKIQFFPKFSTLNTYTSLTHQFLIKICSFEAHYVDVGQKLIEL